LQAHSLIHSGNRYAVTRTKWHDLITERVSGRFFSSLGPGIRRGISSFLEGIKESL